MDPDGKNQRHFARGLRNAVGLRWLKGRLYATNMGSDHLGDNRPADTFYAVEDGKNYGWPYCFQAGSRIYPDPKFNTGSRFDCRKAPEALTAFLLRLEKEPRFAEVLLSRQGARGAPGAGAVQFEIRVRWKS